MAETRASRSKGKKLDSIISKLKIHTPQEEPSKPENKEKNENIDSGGEADIIARKSKRKPGKILRYRIDDDDDDYEQQEENEKPQSKNNSLEDETTQMNNDDDDDDTLPKAIFEELPNGEADFEEGEDTTILFLPSEEIQVKAGPSDDYYRGLLDDMEDGYQDEEHEEETRKEKKKKKKKSKTYESDESLDEDGLPRRVTCTACGRHVNPAHGTILRHPILNVLVCKKCNQYYNSGPFTRDEYGIEEQCRWCGDGGDLICCDKCEKVYCKSCLQRNCGKTYLKNLLNAPEDFKWLCIVCNKDKPLRHVQRLRKKCDLIMEALDRLKAQKAHFKSKKGKQPSVVIGPTPLERRSRLTCLSEGIGIQGESLSSSGESPTKKSFPKEDLPAELFGKSESEEEKEKENQKLKGKKKDEKEQGEQESENDINDAEKEIDNEIEGKNEEKDESITKQQSSRNKDETEEDKEVVLDGTSETPDEGNHLSSREKEVQDTSTRRRSLRRKKSLGEDDCKSVEILSGGANEPTEGKKSGKEGDKLESTSTKKPAKKGDDLVINETNEPGGEDEKLNDKDVEKNKDFTTRQLSTRRKLANARKDDTDEISETSGEENVLDVEMGSLGRSDKGKNDKEKADQNVEVEERRTTGNQKNKEGKGDKTGESKEKKKKKDKLVDDDEDEEVLSDVKASKTELKIKTSKVKKKKERDSTDQDDVSLGQKVTLRKEEKNKESKTTKKNKQEGKKVLPSDKDLSSVQGEDKEMLSEDSNDVHDIEEPSCDEQEPRTQKEKKKPKDGLVKTIKQEFENGDSSDQFMPEKRLPRRSKEKANKMLKTKGGSADKETKKITSRTEVILIDSSDDEMDIGKTIESEREIEKVDKSIEKQKGNETDSIQSLRINRKKDKIKQGLVVKEEEDGNSASGGEIEKKTENKKNKKTSEEESIAEESSGKELIEKEIPKGKKKKPSGKQKGKEKGEKLEEKEEHDSSSSTTETEKLKKTVIKKKNKRMESEEESTVGESSKEESIEKKIPKGKKKVGKLSGKQKEKEKWEKLEVKEEEDSNSSATENENLKKRKKKKKVNEKESSKEELIETKIKKRADKSSGKEKVKEKQKRLAVKEEEDSSSTSENEKVRITVNKRQKKKELSEEESTEEDSSEEELIEEETSDGDSESDDSAPLNKNHKRISQKNSNESPSSSESGIGKKKNSKKTILNKKKKQLQESSESEEEDIPMAKKTSNMENEDEENDFILDSSSDDNSEESEEASDSEKETRPRGRNRGMQKQTRKRPRPIASSSSEKSSEESDDSIGIARRKRKRRQEGSDSSEIGVRRSRKTKGKGKANKKKGKITSKRQKRNILDSDEQDESDKESSFKSESSSDSESEQEEKSRRSKRQKQNQKKKAKRQAQNKKKRRRVQKNLDSDDNEDEEEEKSPRKGRKKIRKLLTDEKLGEETQKARRLEEERRKRLLERTRIAEDEEMPKESWHINALVLEKDEETKEPLVQVHKDLIQYLKPHQSKGIQFMYNNVVDSIKAYKKGDSGGGCILAHCMGLGKTLQVVTLIHTLFNSEHLDFKTALIIAPLNTVLNWQVEFDKWLGVDERMEVFVLKEAGANNWRRADMLKQWERYGGVMIMGYDMYRNLALCHRTRSKHQKKIFKQTLVDPGPDIVVCDEGHILRNDQSAISKTVNDIKTKRRIVLTGTPLQNNLIEYHCMVSFVKPSLLGTRREFMNTFGNPILNGQCADSTAMDVRLMKQRCHVLYKLLEACVQRRDYSVLTPFLPPKHEYVIHIRLSETQRKLYEHYLKTFVYTDDSISRAGGSSLFSDYQALMRIWTHPWCLKLEAIRRSLRAPYEDSDDSLDGFVVHSDEEEEESELSNSSEVSYNSLSEDSNQGKNKKKMNNIFQLKSSSESESNNNTSDEEVMPQPSARRTRSQVPTKTEDKTEVVVVDVNGDDNGQMRNYTRSGAILKENEPVVEEKEWYDEFLTDEDEYNVELSGKMAMLLEILADAEAVEEKVLVFSQSLVTLDLIERALGGGEVGGDQENWCRGCDYFRMDGSTSVQLRQRWSDIFNDVDNKTARLFLISTKAGGLGINLVAANRVIVFDVSWNPSHDVQSIFRVYRFGQTRPVYVYRLVTQGTMEEKIYDRQVAKLSISERVIDKHQIERHFTAADLAELYTFNPEVYDEEKDKENTPTLPLPKDAVLADLINRMHPKWIVKYHEHDSLLQNKADEELTEEECRLAWSAYEAQKDQAKNQEKVRALQAAYAQQQLQQQRQAIPQQNTQYNSVILQEMQQLQQQQLSERLSRYQADVGHLQQIRQQYMSQQNQNSMLQQSRTEQLRQQLLQHVGANHSVYQSHAAPAPAQAPATAGPAYQPMMRYISQQQQQQQQHLLQQPVPQNQRVQLPQTQPLSHPRASAPPMSVISHGSQYRR